MLLIRVVNALPTSALRLSKLFKETLIPILFSKLAESLTWLLSRTGTSKFGPIGNAARRAWIPVPREMPQSFPCKEQGMQRLNSHFIPPVLASAL